MKQTILITGCSSGIGRAAVEHFSQKGWQVAATMRNPDRDGATLAKLPGVRIYKMDVTDEGAVRSAVDAAIRDFGGLDAICNNAGYGTVGIFEKATPEQIRKQFDTNVFGCMNVIRAVLPHFRAKMSGTIINVTSMGGLITFPVYSVYHGTKWAMEGFSESLAFELRPLGIKVRCIEPGAIKTDFYDRSQDKFEHNGITDYDGYERIAHQNMQTAGATAPGPELVAVAIFKAATDKGFRLRYAAGRQSGALLLARRILPAKAFFGLVRSVVEKGFKAAS